MDAKRVAQQCLVQHAIRAPTPLHAPHSHVMPTRYNILCWSFLNFSCSFNKVDGTDFVCSFCASSLLFFSLMQMVMQPTDAKHVLLDTKLIKVSFLSKFFCLSKIKIPMFWQVFWLTFVYFNLFLAVHFCFALHIATQSCTACSAGQFSSADFPSCTACSSGQFQEASAGTECKVCDAGQSSQTASTACSTPSSSPAASPAASPDTSTSNTPIPDCDYTEIDSRNPVDCTDGGIRNLVDVSSSTGYMYSNIWGKYGNINEWDTSLVTDLSHLFEGKGSNIDISKWNTSRVTTMHSSTYIFFSTHINCHCIFVNVLDFFLLLILSFFIILTQLSAFYNAQLFNADISAWDVGAVTTMVSSKCTIVLWYSFFMIYTGLFMFTCMCIPCRYLTPSSIFSPWSKNNYPFFFTLDHSLI